jgi:TetR/AcrR family transcriptional repressor of bet genes
MANRGTSNDKSSPAGKRVSPEKGGTAPRTASKAERRTQLIEATIRSIAANGLSETTTSVVAGEAGLSQGIINLHFESKDKLLLATLARVVDEYRALWEAALEAAPDDPAARLAALVEVDFHPSVCDRDKLAVWFAFWSESKARPTYRKLCADRDRDYDRVMRELCRELVAEGRYDVDPDLAARALAAITEGLWLDMLISPRNLSRREALRVSMAYLAHLFPRHFSTEEERKAS